MQIYDEFVRCHSPMEEIKKLCSLIEPLRPVFDQEERLHMSAISLYRKS